MSTTTRTSPTKTNGEVESATGKRKRGGRQGRQQQQETGAPQAYSALALAANVAKFFKRELTAEETAKIMAAVQGGKVKLSASADEWQEQARTLVAMLDPLGELGLDAEPASSQVVLPPLAQPKPSRELKALIREDKNFLKKLDKFANMSDKEFGEYGNPIVAKIQDKGRLALVNLEAGRKLFRENLPFFYEVKMRLLNPKYRPDLNGGRERTVEDNQEHFGVSDWAAFRAKFVVYSLAQADKLLRGFKQEADRIGDGTLDGSAVSAAETGTSTETGKGGRAGKTVDLKAARQAKLADTAKKMINLALNAPEGITFADYKATMQAVAEHEYEDMSAEEALALRMPKIVKHRFTAVEKIGINLAKLVHGRKLDKPFTVSQRMDLMAMASMLLQAAGVLKPSAASPAAKPAASAIKSEADEAKAS